MTTEELIEKWRSDARAMDEIADEDCNDGEEAKECIERAKTLRDCASELERTFTIRNHKTYYHEPDCPCDECRQYWGEPPMRNALEGRAAGAGGVGENLPATEATDNDQAQARRTPCVATNNPLPESSAVAHGYILH